MILTTPYGVFKISIIDVCNAICIMSSTIFDGKIPVQLHIKRLFMHMSV